VTSSTRERSRTIAHLLPWPGIGGTEHATLRIASAVRERGFRSVVFHLEEATAVRTMFEQAGFDTIAYAGVHASFRRPTPFLLNARRIARKLREHGTDLLHCADLTGAYYGAAAGKLAGIPVLSHVRNPFPDIALRDRGLLWAVDRFAFVSKDTWRRFGVPIPAGKGTVLYDGLSVPDAPDVSHRSAVRAEFGIGAEAPLVGMVARVSPQKDFITLAKAAGRVLQQFPTARFMIIGDHELEPAHRHHFAIVRDALRAEHVLESFVFTGFRSDIGRLMSGLDLFVLSTHFEGLPLVILEAMAAGLPVVATAVNGIPEIIPSERVGLLVPPGDDAALARGITLVLSDAGRRASIGDAGRAFVRASFSSTAFADNLVRLYDDMAR
jgi:glycosyltransferase involved in cell wall biosynthesis